MPAPASHRKPGETTAARDTSRTNPAAIQRKCSGCQEHKTTEIDKVGESQIQRQEEEDSDKEKVIESPPMVITPNMPAFSCEPKGYSRKAFLAQAGTTQEMLGLTTLDVGTALVPEAVLVKKKKRWAFEQTKASVGKIPSVYTKSGSYTEGEIESGSKNCKRKKYPVKWTITPKAAQKIKEGEQEHCNDFHHAFKITLQAYAHAVNHAAANKTFPSQKSGIRYIQKQTGSNPANWQKRFAEMAKKSLIRDSNHWHKPKVEYHSPHYRSNCKHARAWIREDSFKHVGKHSTESIIK